MRTIIIRLFILLGLIFPALASAARKQWAGRYKTAGWRWAMYRAQMG